MSPHPALYCDNGSPLPVAHSSSAFESIKMRPQKASHFESQSVNLGKMSQGAHADGSLFSFSARPGTSFVAAFLFRQNKPDHPTFLRPSSTNNFLTGQVTQV